MRGFFILSLVLFFKEAKSQPVKVHYGLYENYTLDKSYAAQLKLSCDFTFQYSFKGSRFEDFYSGTWKQIGDSLKLSIDSSNTTTHTYKHEIIFKIDPVYVKLYEQSGRSIQKNRVMTMKEAFHCAL